MDRPTLLKFIDARSVELEPLIDELKLEFMAARQELSPSPADLIQELSRANGSYSRIMEVRSISKKTLDSSRGYATEYHGDENAKTMENLVDADTAKIAYAYNLASGLSYVLKLRIESIRSIIAFNREEMGAIQ